MSNKKSIVNYHVLEFYKNYCASKSTCIALIVFSSLWLMFFWSILNFPDRQYIGFLQAMSPFVIIVHAVLSICYTVFYSKVVDYIKRFKIQKELSVILKMSTTILTFTWICFCWACPICIVLLVLPEYILYAHQTIIFSLLFIILMPLLPLSSVGLWTYIKYGKKYEIFSEYKLIKKGEKYEANNRRKD